MSQKHYWREFALFPSRCMTNNEMFRAVHDINGHYRSPDRPHSPYETFEGEIAAYYTHKTMYSERAMGALFGETVGQLCYHAVYGKFVDNQECKVLPVRF